MLTSLSFLCAQRKGAPDYSPETREQPVALLAQPASYERPLLEGEPLSLCSELLRLSVATPTVSSEGQKSKVFRDTPRSLCRGFLLFTGVRGRGVLRSSPYQSSRKFRVQKVVLPSRSAHGWNAVDPHRARRARRSTSGRSVRSADLPSG